MTRGIDGNETPASTDLEANGPHKTPIYLTSADTTCNHSQASKDSSQSRNTEANDDDDNEDIDIRHGDDIEKHKEMIKIKKQTTTDLRLALTKSDGGPIYIEFGPDDPGNPMNWPTGEYF